MIFLYFRQYPLCSNTSESEDINDHVDDLLLSDFKKYRYKINYISNRDLFRLYDEEIFFLFIRILFLIRKKALYSGFF
jgi:hypothetical protein